MTNELMNGPKSDRARLIFLLAGVAICQFLLYGPSLLGRSILLPLV